MERRILIFHRAHNGKAMKYALLIATKLRNAGRSVEIVTDTKGLKTDAELIVVLGGDGTILEAAEIACNSNLPIMGVNLGHIGFLAEAEKADTQTVVERIIERSYEVDERLTIDVTVRYPDGNTEKSWALNEAAILGVDRAHPALFALGVDSEAVSEFGADGLIIATPTGSTAYAFSAGGPIVWPDVQAIEVLPLAGFGLFTRPLIVDPESVVEVLVLPKQRQEAQVWCDGRRILPAPPGTIVTITRGSRRARLARINNTPFSARLVAKFDLPVEGWRRGVRD